MSSFDYAIAAMIVLFAAVGVLRGLIREGFSLATWVIAFVVGWLFAHQVAGWLERLIREPTVRIVLAFLLVFVVVHVIGGIVTGYLHRVVESKPLLKVPNHILGGVVGGARGVVVLVILFLLAGLTNLPQRPWWRRAALAPYLESAALYAADFLPADIARHIRYG